MGFMIAMGAVGVAGGILGGMQKGAEQQAQFEAQRIEVERNNFFGQLESDRQTEAIATANVNSLINDQKMADAAMSNRFYASWQNQKQTTDALQMNYQSARAAKATLESQYTGKTGSLSGGTAAALKKQTQKAQRDQMLQIRNKEYEQGESIQQNFENQMSQRSLGMGRQEGAAFMPGSTGIAPSKNAALMEGIFSGISGGLGMASGAKGLMS
jgi:hypothetical protein